MRTAAAVFGCLVVGLAWAGCSSTDNQPKGAGGSGGSGGHAGGSSDDGGRDPNLNCVKPGTPSNEKGIGGYCETNDDCASATGGLIVCSGAFDTTPRYSWFCTTLCNVDADCGTGAYCGHSDQGNGCVPFSCGTRPEGGDASMDAATDRALDALPEATPDVAAEGGSDAAGDVQADVPTDVVGDAPSEAPSSDGAAD